MRGQRTDMHSRRQSAIIQEGYFELKEGSLYPALHRLERQKLLRFVVARGRRPAAEILRTDSIWPDGAGVLQAVVGQLCGRR